MLRYICIICQCVHIIFNAIKILCMIFQPPGNDISVTGFRLAETAQALSTKLKNTIKERFIVQHAPIKIFLVAHQQILSTFDRIPVDATAQRTSFIESGRIAKIPGETLSGSTDVDVILVCAKVYDFGGFAIHPKNSSIVLIAASRRLLSSLMVLSSPGVRGPCRTSFA